MEDRHIVIVGEMGAGKTTVGEILARELNRRFLDSDRVIEESLHRTGALIAETEGVETLHRAEVSALRLMLDAHPPAVIAAAASVVDSPRGREMLEAPLVVRLTAPDSVLVERQAADSHRRSVSNAERQDLRDRRLSHFEHLADLTLDTATSKPDVLAGQLVGLVGQGQGPT